MTKCKTCKELRKEADYWKALAGSRWEEIQKLKAEIERKQDDGADAKYN